MFEAVAPITQWGQPRALTRGCCSKHGTYHFGWCALSNDDLFGVLFIVFGDPLLEISLV